MSFRKMSDNLEDIFKFVFIILSCLWILPNHDAIAKPTISFTLPPSLTSSIPSLSQYTRQYVERKQTNQMKTYRWVYKSTYFSYKKTYWIVVQSHKEIELYTSLTRIYKQRKLATAYSGKYEANPCVFLKLKRFLLFYTLKCSRFTHTHTIHHVLCFTK